jgi:hypothetical protein
MERLFEWSFTPSLFAAIGIAQPIDQRSVMAGEISLVLFAKQCG